MKLLLVFIDMFRANLLNSWNNNNKKTNVDRLIEKWGGTIYTNCFSPSPDTPRSNGCLWTSLYPKKNGCDTRIKYPKHFLNKPQNNFLRVFVNHGYKLNLLINPCNEKIGELPEDYSRIAYYSEGKRLDKALDEVDVSQNSITYISIKDYHFLVDDWRASPIAADKADVNISRQLELIDQRLHIDQFDIVVLFSDHGWTMATETYQKAIEGIGDNRDKILMFIHRKGDTKIHADNRLCSILDIGPTLAEFSNFNLTYEHDGLSLFSENKHDFLLVEDHKDFNVTLSQAIEIWGVRYSNGRFICRCSDGEWESNGDGVTEAEIEMTDQIFKEYGTSYEKNIMAGQIMKRYKDLKTMDTYFDGSPRIKHIRIKTRIKERIQKFLG